ncbi:MAG: hypothetical protein IJH38_08410 [Clostridia bacterium]|nr:hypothetical protein [Clostridia bacterium]
MKLRWLAVWMIQIGSMMAIGMLTALMQMPGGLPGGILLWAAMPLTGALSAYHAVRNGLNNYLAWIAPAPCLFAAYAILWGYSPPAGAGILTAFVSLVGAATGEVRNSRNDHQNPGRSRR